MAGIVKVSLLLFLLYFISPNLFGQGGQPVTCPDCPAIPAGGTPIRVDGNPCDWRSGNISQLRTSNPSMVFAYRQDPYGNVSDTSFTEGSKDFMTAANLTWTFGQTKAKNDIANAAVAILGDTLYFAGDRTSNNGDAQIGFWFYLGGTAPAANTHFAPEHTVGDILVLADFTGGGNFGTVTVYKWVGSGGSVPNTNGTLEYFTTCGNGAVVVAENNAGATKVPFEGNFDQPCYELNEFYEGKIPLSCILQNSGSYCISSFLLETRSSQSITASLDDFVSGGFDAQPSPTASATGTNPTCFGASNGSINLTVGGTGNTPTYSWTKVGGSMPAGQANVEDPQGLSAGTYNVTVTVQGALSCFGTATAQAILTNPTQITASASASGTNPNCFGASNGSINLTVTTNAGGSPTFAWTKVGGSMPAGQGAVEDPAGLSAGTYNVVVTVGNSTCSATATAQAILVNPPQITATASAVGTNPSCFGSSDGSINLSYGTNDGAATFAWTKVGGSMPAGQGTVEDPAGLSAGTYNVVVTVGGTCSATATAQAILVNPTQITASASTTRVNPSCNGSSDGSIDLTVSTNDGTPTYVWTKVGGSMPAGQGTVQDPAGLSAGTYNVVVTVGNSTCSATATAQAILTNPPQITATASAVGTNPSCFGSSDGSINLTVTTNAGGTPTYVWTKVGGSMPAGQGTVEDPAGLSAGTYNVVVTVGNSTCSATTTAQAILVNPTQITASASTTRVNPSCNGSSDGSIDLTVSTNAGGSPSYVWTKVGGSMPAGQANVQDPSGLSAGTYNVVVTVGASTCTATAAAQAILTNPAQLTVTASAVGTNPTCFGASNGSINLTTGTNDGTPTYVWTKVGGSMPAGQGTVEDPAGLSAGTYNVVVTVGNSTCSATTTAQAILTNPAQLTVTASAVGTNPTCFGASNGSINLTTGTNDGTPTYVWTKVGGSMPAGQGTVEDPAGLSAGTYNVVVTVGNSTCSATTTAQAILTNPAQLTVTASAVGTNPTCGGTDGSIALTYGTNDGTPTFAWTKVGGGFTSSVQNPTGLSGGTYNVVVTVGNSTCSATTTASVVLTSAPCLTYCSYTQGFWGNKNGLKYMRDSGLLSTNLVIGIGPKSILIPAGSWTALNGMMPGGSTPDALSSTSPAQCSITAPCFSTYLDSKGKINNVFLSQTITLALNSRIRGGILAGLPIQPGGCLNTSAGSFPLDASVIAYLTWNGATPHVSDLLELANKLLGGSLIPGQDVGTLGNPRIVPSYSAVNSVVDAYNNAFDGCQSFIGYGTCVVEDLTVSAARQSRSVSEATESAVSGLAVQAYPNPFRDVVKFTIQSKVSGQAQLVIYNTLGQRVKTIYNGYLQANKSQVVEYRNPSPAQGNLFYILSIGGKQVTGKLLRMD
jgi:hypothetical protein